MTVKYFFKCAHIILQNASLISSSLGNCVIDAMHADQFLWLSATATTTMLREQSSRGTTADGTQPTAEMPLLPNTGNMHKFGHRGLLQGL